VDTVTLALLTSGCAVLFGAYIGARVALWARARGERDAAQAVEALEELEDRVERLRRAVKTLQDAGWWTTTTTASYTTDQQTIEDHGLGEDEA